MEENINFSISDQQRRHDIRELWKATFGDSDDYINLVLHDQLSSEYVLTRYDNGQLKAMLVGIPYSFSFAKKNINESDGEIIRELDKIPEMRGLYLCGLATEKSFRRQGIMTEMLEEINSKASAEGFDFTFLIPADDQLREYYLSRSYIDAIRRSKETYFAGHNFRKELKTINSNDIGEFDDLIISNISSRDKIDFLKVIDYIYNYKNSEYNLALRHSKEDIERALHENYISDGDGIYVKDENECLKGVLLYYRKKENKVLVYYLQYSDMVSRMKLLDALSQSERDSELIVLLPESQVPLSDEAIWTPYYIGAEAEQPNLHYVDKQSRGCSKRSLAGNYGMIRVLRIENLAKIISRAKIRESHDRGEKLDENEAMLQTEQFLSGMTPREIGEIVFRKYRVDDTITRDFGIPPISISIPLMLD